MLLLHRPFIEGTLSAQNNTLSEKSRRSCEHAAYNIMVIIQQKQALMNEYDSYSPLCLPTFFVYSMFQSCLIHLALVFQNQNSLIRLNRLQHAISILKQYENQLASAQRAHHIIMTVITVHGIHLDNATTADQDNYLVLLDNPDFSPATCADEDFSSLDPQIQYDMPKSNWYQRKIDTDIISSITSDFHEDLSHSDSSPILIQSSPKLNMDSTGDHRDSSRPKQSLNSAFCSFSNNAPMYEKSIATSTATTTSTLNVMNDPYSTMYPHLQRSTCFYETPSSHFTTYDMHYNSSQPFTSASMSSYAPAPVSEIYTPSSQHKSEWSQHFLCPENSSLDQRNRQPYLQ